MNPGCAGPFAITSLALFAFTWTGWMVEIAIAGNPRPDLGCRG